jgi:hypothetical protein
MSRSKLPSISDYHGEFGLDLSQQKIILEFARDVMNNRATSLPTEFANYTAAIILCMFSESGSLIGIFRIDGPTIPIDTKIRTAIEKIRQTKNWETHSKREVADGKPKDFIHLMIVGTSARFFNFGVDGLFEYRVYEPQVTGIIYHYKGQRGEVTPMEAIMRGLGPDDSREIVAKRANFDPSKMWQTSELEIELYKVLHFGESYPARKFQSYFRGHRFISANEVTYQEIQHRLEYIGQWFQNNITDGEVTYMYSPSHKTYDDSSRTVVRTTMALWVLNRLAIFLKNDSLLKQGEVTIHSALEKYYLMDESLKKGQLTPSKEEIGQGQSGELRWTAAGFIAAAILERGELTRYQKEVDLLLDWAMKKQSDNGFLWTPWAVDQFFMPGQFLLVIARFYQTTGDEKYRRFFDKSFAAYEKQILDLFEFSKYNFATVAPAWFTQAFVCMALATGDDRYCDIVWKINERVLSWYVRGVEFQRYPDYDGVLAPLNDNYYGNNSVTAASLESLVDAAILAKAKGLKEKQQEYMAIARHTIAYLMRLQYLPENSYHFEHRERVIGGFKTDLIKTTIWMDNVWHLTSAFMKIKTHSLFD